MLENLSLTLQSNNQEILSIARALSSPQRLEILKLLNTSSLSVTELSQILKSPLSTTLLHVNILAECNLITIKETYTKKGKSKLCSRNCDSIDIMIFKANESKRNVITFDIPIGNYVEYDIPYSTGCGIATDKHNIGIDNDPDVFFSEERHNAGCIWFNQGFLTYRVPNKMLPQKIESVSISFEVCSEAPFYRNDWKSDITMWICDKEVGTWTSLGDYGGRRGKNNPKRWPDAITQYGVLTNWKITQEGTFVNSTKISDFTIRDINFKEYNNVSIKIGVKKDAKYCGGMNLFGKSFGDYSQDIKVEFTW